jgi:hypothetical protein
MHNKMMGLLVVVALLLLADAAASSSCSKAGHSSNKRLWLCSEPLASHQTHTHPVHFSTHQHSWHILYAPLEDAAALNGSSTRVIPYPESLKGGAHTHPQEEEQKEVCFDVTIHPLESSHAFIAEHLKPKFPDMSAVVDSEEHLDVCVGAERRGDMLRTLHSTDFVMHVEAQTDFETHMNYAKRVVLFNERTEHPSASSWFPFSGRGQLISIADTGIDQSHCLFQAEDKVLGIRQVVTARERMMPQMFTRRNTQHGTHIASIVAGSASRYSG